MTDLSVIIVCYKGWDRLIKCLESLDSFTGKDFSLEVIIVDNKSADETFAIIEKKFSRFKFVRNEINGGFANGCNLGAKNAVGEYFLFLNPDTVATESEVGKLLNYARQNLSYSILSCRQVNENGRETGSSGPFPQLLNLTGLQRSVFGRLTSHNSGLREKGQNNCTAIKFPDWISGSVVLMRKELFNRINGFDEDFWMYFEDVDLCKRVRNLGGEIALCRDVTIEHNHGGSSRINLKTASLTKTEVHISRHVYISKHKKGIDKFIIQTFLIVNNIISGGLMALAGLLLFFIPKVFSRTLIFCRLIKYYALALLRLTLISPRSAHFGKS